MQLGDKNVRRIGSARSGFSVRTGSDGRSGPRQRPPSLARAASAVDVIDTADCYGPDYSEEMIARTLHPYRDGLVIATKGGLTCPRPGVWIPSAAPDRLRRSCLRSMRRLRVKQIELYQLHAIDPEVEFERSVEALAQLQQDGLVCYIGLCNVSRGHVERALRIVDIASVQNSYNVVRRVHDDVVDLCAAERIAFLPWFPLERGALVGSGFTPLTVVAGRYQATSAQVALAWLLHRSPAILPIPGTSSFEHLQENLSAAGLVLDDNDMRVLERMARREGEDRR